MKAMFGIRPARVAGGALVCATAALYAAVATAQVTPDPPVPQRQDPAEDSPLSPTVLDAAGAVIGRIRIENGDVFDPDIPGEDRALYRLANRIHATTKREVIRQQLLFEPGDPFSAQEIEESERILRQNKYLQDATIQPVSEEDGVVDVLIRTSDSWTLAPRLSFSRSGGRNTSGVGIKETNLFGTGMEVETLYESGIDRDTMLFQVADRHLFGSWYALNAIYQDNSDGNLKLVDLGKPFYSLNTRSAYGLVFEDWDRVDSLYDLGEITGQFRHESRKQEIFAGFSPGLRDGWTRRFIAGIGLDEHRFTPVGADFIPVETLPADRRFVYPFVGFELVQDDFRESTNLDQIRRTEDRFLGTAFRAQLGLAAPGLGSDRQAWLFRTGARTTTGDPDERLFTFASDVTGRLESGGIRNLLVNVSGRYYRRRSEHRVFFAELSATLARDLDAEQQILLGGDNGLRGYPLRYQAGDKRLLLTVEERLFTDWYPFRLFRVGGAVFFDAGRAWGSEAAGQVDNRVLKDVGFGLRIGNPRSSRGHMAHVDVAFPLDGGDSIEDVQFLVSVKESF